MAAIGRQLAVLELAAFLEDQPLVALRPKTSDDTVLKGPFRVHAKFADYPEIDEFYRLNISIPRDFPKALPVVKEIEGRIPRLADFHVNQDGSLCLGSRLRLMMRLQRNPTLAGFACECVVPFLYAMSLKLTLGVDFIFGELPHGRRGEVDDYRDLLDLKNEEQIIPALRAILKKRRLANKLPCPCGCSQRLGKCPFNSTIREFRKALPKGWLRQMLTGRR